MVVHVRFAGWLMWGALVASLGAACGPNAYDVYLQAMQTEQKAARSSCKLIWDAGAGAHVVNSDKITACLTDLKEAQALYHRARELGSQGSDFATAIESIDAQVVKVQGMLRAISHMEQDKRQSQVEKQVN